MMKATILAVALGVGAILVVGCGDDTTETGATGGSGNATSTTTGTAGSGNTSSSSSSAATGTGGEGTGGMGTGGMGTGGMGTGGMGTGGAGTGDFGDDCSGNGDCKAPYVCFKFGMGQMQCTKACGSDADCAPESDQCNGMGYCKP